MVELNGEARHRGSPCIMSELLLPGGTRGHTLLRASMLHAQAQGRWRQQALDASAHILALANSKERIDAEGARDGDEVRLSEDRSR